MPIMKGLLVNEDKEALVRYRLKEARDSVEEARVLLKEGITSVPL